MVRQNALTNEEWTEYIRIQAERITPHLNTLTLSSLGHVGVLFDDFGRHTLKSCYSQTNTPLCLLDHGIYPPEDERVSVNEFFYEDGDIDKKTPIRVIQRLWAFGRNADWITIEVRSDISYESHGEHHGLRRLRPTLVDPHIVELDDVLKFTGLTPKALWYDFTASIEILLNRRKEFLFRVLEIEKAIKQDKFQLEQIPDGGRGLFG